MLARPTHPPDASALSLAERGRSPDGAPRTLDRRLFFALFCFDGAGDTGPLEAAFRASGLPGVLYADLHRVTGVAVLTFSEDPEAFVTTARAVLTCGPFSALVPRPERTLVGRTYAVGYEPDLEDALLARPRRRALDPATPWHVWYPVRRAGVFALLPADEQRAHLMEHGAVGRRFGEAGHAHDIRLASHGLDQDDADFVIGITAPTLTGASALVQAMRATQQTARYLDRLGPFFVGRVIAQTEG